MSPLPNCIGESAFGVTLTELRFRWLVPVAGTRTKWICRSRSFALRVITGGSYSSFAEAFRSIIFTPGTGSIVTTRMARAS